MDDGKSWLLLFVAATLIGGGVSCRYFETAQRRENLGAVQEDTMPTRRVMDLEQKVYVFNNAFLYDSSQWYIRRFLENSDLSNSERFYAFLYNSYTYKRIFDYTSTLSKIDSAWYYGQRTPYENYFRANMYAQKALALFDISQYSKAAELMKSLSDNHYEGLTMEYKSKIVMQEAYLHYLRKEYGLAESSYKMALNFMRKSSPCDLPMIYGKQIELYSATKDTLAVKRIFREGMKNADSCGIKKYNMYLFETMAKGYAEAQDYKLALYYYNMFQAMHYEYTSADYVKKLANAEAKYKAMTNEKELLIQKNKLYEQEVFIWVLFIILIAMVCVGVAYTFWQRQIQILQKNKAQQIFTQQLFQNTEAERERIARDLHDGINHKLLLLRRNWAKTNPPQEEIDKLIDEIRKICRNLHPVMLQSIGLKLSIETLCQQFSDTETLFVAHQIEYPKKLISLDEELQIYRIIQEALSNSAKYAQANAAKVTILAEEGKQIFIEVRDNGKGFDVEKALNSANAFGLHSILQRAHYVGANAHISSSPKGTVVQIKISMTS